MTQRTTFVKEYQKGLHFVIRSPRPYKYCPSFPKDKANEVNEFYAKLEEYNNTITPIIPLKNLAKHIGIKNILIKDESIRFNLSSFKGLGGLYTVAKLLCDELLNIDLNEIQNLKHLKKLIDNKGLNKSMTIITASDGNHGRGIAYCCSCLDIKCIILMPKGTVKSRVDNINIYKNAKVIVTELNYDETVLYAFKMAKENKNYYIIQDVATSFYKDIPLNIMSGYAQIAKECFDQLNNMKIWPTHIILQVGVGAFASSILSYFINNIIDKSKMPKIITIEPMNAAPLYKTAKYNNKNDNKLENVSDSTLESIMAGLACGVLTEIGGEILNKYVNVYCRANDFISSDSIRILANPLNNDKKILSGESGGVGVGLLYHLCINKQYQEIKNKINLNHNSTILIINTEGITDPVNWNKIVQSSFNYRSKL